MGADQPGRVRVRRVYDDPDPADGQRVLVDRLWPRGFTKERAALDAWSQDVAPSPELRRWYSHEVPRFDEFAERYRVELTQGPAAEAVAQLRTQRHHGPLTLLTATKDVEHSSARVLADVLG